MQVSADAVAEERDRQASGLVALLPVELNVFNCHRQLVGQGFQGLYIAVVKGVRFHPFDVYNGNDLLSHPAWHGQSSVVSGMACSKGYTRLGAPMLHSHLVFPIRLVENYPN